jgi:hypothetical protein
MRKPCWDSRHPVSVRPQPGNRATGQPGNKRRVTVSSNRLSLGAHPNLSGLRRCSTNLPPHHAGTRPHFTAARLQNSGTRPAFPDLRPNRSGARRSFPDVRRNHSGAAKTLKNPIFSAILDCGDMSPLSPDATCRVVSKRGHVRALQISTLTRPSATLSHRMGEGWGEGRLLTPNHPTTQ